MRRRDLSSPRTAVNPHGSVTLPGDEYDALFYAWETLQQIAKMGVVFDAKGTRSKQINDMARQAIERGRHVP